MLLRRRRIPQSLFPALSRGTIFSGDFFSLKTARNPRTDDPCRFAIVVSTKAARSAVVRNRLRRTGYAAIDSKGAAFPKGNLLAFFAKLNAKNASRGDLEKDITALLVKAKIISP